MEIQLLEKLHIEACSQLFVEAFSREPWNEQYESDREVIGYFTAFISLDSFLGFVGIESGRVIALCVGMRKPWLKGVEYYIDQFCVAPDFQCRGIGRQTIPCWDRTSHCGFRNERYPAQHGKNLSGIRILP